MDPIQYKPFSRRGEPSNETSYIYFKFKQWTIPKENSPLKKQ